jgi:hypothetical protein
VKQAHHRIWENVRHSVESRSGIKTLCLIGNNPNASESRDGPLPKECYRPFFLLNHQCIMKERPDGGVGWMAPPPLRYAVQGFAALLSDTPTIRGNTRSGKLPDVHVVEMAFPFERS